MTAAPREGNAAVKLNKLMDIIALTTRKAQAKKRKTRNPITWLRQVTSGLTFGIELTKTVGCETKKVTPHCNDKHMILDFLRNPRVFRINRLRNADYEQHFAGQRTYFYAGQSRASHKLTLLYVDIDCKHGKGSAAGADHFAKIIGEKFPVLAGAQWERSRGGIGKCGYVVIDRGDLDAETVNGLYGRLERNLKAFLARGDYDVSDVEVKGRCPVVTYGPDRKAAAVKCGTLARLPRSRSTVQALMMSKPVPATEIMRLPVLNDKPESVKVKPSPVVRISAGSVSGRHFHEPELRRMRNDYTLLGRQLLVSDRLNTSGRTVVTARDLGIYLMIVKFCTLNMNADGSLPSARIRALWSALFEAGDIDRQYDPKRAAVMRDLLDSYGYLTWEDESYTVGQHGSKGKACKWRGSDSLLEIMKDERASFGGTELTVPKQKKKSEITRPILRWTIALLPDPEDLNIPCWPELALAA